MEKKRRKDVRKENKRKSGKWLDIKEKESVI
jgi:hypothetical protein